MPADASPHELAAHRRATAAIRLRTRMEAAEEADRSGIAIGPIFAAEIARAPGRRGAAAPGDRG